jgi:hypothetical protein
MVLQTGLHKYWLALNLLPKLRLSLKVNRGCQPWAQFHWCQVD